MTTKQCRGERAIPFEPCINFDRAGYIGPLPVVAGCAALELQARIEGAVAANASPSGPFDGLLRKVGLKKKPRSKTMNRHFDWAHMAQLAAHPAVLDAVASVLGDEIALWRSNIFIQTAVRGTGLNWHRDVYPRILKDASKQVSVQFALSATTPENCMEIIPSSHRLEDAALGERYGLKPRAVTERAGNRNYRGGETLAVPTQVVMAPGEALIFAPELIHRSSTSNAGNVAARCCVTFRYTVNDNVVDEAGAPRRIVLRGSQASYESAHGRVFDWREGVPA
ncbi:MAG: phytanoyl-CoA dioxygenase family protein [Pseudomonadota bacterium]